MDQKEITTIKGYKATINTRITSRIYRQIQGAMYEGMRVDTDSGKISMNLAGVQKQQEKAMTLLLVSITDTAGTIHSGPTAYEFLQNMQDYADAEEIYKAVDQLTTQVPLVQATGANLS